MRRLGQIEGRREFGQCGRRGGFLRFLMREKILEVLLGVLLHQAQVIGALAALRAQDAHALTLRLGQPHFDYRAVVGMRLHEDLFRDRLGAAIAPARAFFLGDRRLLVARRAQRERTARDVARHRRVEPELPAARGVKLLEEFGEQLGLGRIDRAVEDEVFLTEQLAVAHHKDLHARLAALARHRDQIHVDARTPHDLLRFDRAPDRDDPVAQPRRRLEVVVFGRIGHVVLQARDQRVVMAFEKQHDLIDEHVVVRLRLIPHARRETAFDMILQARPLALTVDRFAARA